MDPVNVVFVLPFAVRISLRFVKAVAALPGVRLGVVAMQSADRLPAELRSRLVAHHQVDDAFDAQTLADGVRAISRRMGGKPHRLLATLEQLQVQIAEVRGALGIPGATSAVAANFRDKARMKTVFENAGLPCARHRSVSSAEDALAFAREVGFPLVVKPPDGAGAKATFRAQNEAELADALRVLRPAPGRVALLEEFVQGDEHSFETLSIGGEHVWHGVSHYLPTPLQVVENPWIQWCVLVPREVDHPRYDDIRTAAARALSALGMDTGITHMEWFRRPDGSLAISEVAMRPPGAQLVPLHSYANEFDLFSAWAGVVVHGAFRTPARRYATGAAFFRGQGSGRVKALHGLADAQQGLSDLGVEVVEARMPVPGQPTTTAYEGEGFAIVRHPETAVVHEALGRLVSRIKVEVA